MAAARAVEPTPAPATTPVGEVLTLEQAVALALEGNREVKEAALEVVKAESELGGFKTKALPYFNVYAIASQNLDDVNVRVPAGAFGDFPATRSGTRPAAGSAPGRSP